MDCLPVRAPVRALPTPLPRPRLLWLPRLLPGGDSALSPVAESPNRGGQGTLGNGRRGPDSHAAPPPIRGGQGRGGKGEAAKGGAAKGGAAKGGAAKGGAAQRGAAKGGAAKGGAAKGGAAKGGAAKGGVVRTGRKQGCLPTGICAAAMGPDRGCRGEGPPGPRSGAGAGP